MSTFIVGFHIQDYYLSQVEQAGLTLPFASIYATSATRGLVREKYTYCSNLININVTITSESNVLHTQSSNQLGRSSLALILNKTHVCYFSW